MKNVKKTSWNEFIKYLKSGVIFRGAVFDRELNDIINNSSYDKVVNEEGRFPDRIYNKGTNNIKMDIIDIVGDHVGETWLYKRGKVFLIENEMFAIISENSIIFYQI